MNTNAFVMNKCRYWLKKEYAALLAEVSQAKEFTANALAFSDVYRLVSQSALYARQPAWLILYHPEMGDALAPCNQSDNTQAVERAKEMLKHVRKGGAIVYLVDKSTPDNTNMQTLIILVYESRISVVDVYNDAKILTMAEFDRVLYSL